MKFHLFRIPMKFYKETAFIFFLCSVSVETDNKNGTFLCHFLEIVETLDSFIKFGRQKIETGGRGEMRQKVSFLFVSFQLKLWHNKIKN